jgi:hypothetical protein
MLSFPTQSSLAGSKRCIKGEESILDRDNNIDRQRGTSLLRGMRDRQGVGGLS